MTAPFKGITKRPYDQKILEGFDWHSKDIPIMRLMFSELWLTQEHLNISALLGAQSFSTDLWPRVVLYEREYYLEDGHHRILKSVIAHKARSRHFKVFYATTKL